MRVHNALRNEALPTQPAYVGPFSGVRPFVDPQRRPLSEPLPAELANERFLPGVHSFMFFQLFFSGEALGARRTPVRLVPGVDAPMEL